MLDSILTKKSKPTFVSEENPFASRKPNKPKANIFEEEEEEEVKPAKTNKFDKMMKVDSDDDEKQQKLIQKYTKDIPVADNKSKRKNKLLQDSDEEQAPPIQSKKES